MDGKLSKGITQLPVRLYWPDNKGSLLKGDELRLRVKLAEIEGLAGRRTRAPRCCTARRITRRLHAVLEI
ncbi:hypothetical protein R1CP_37255 (plasmid) [Rhodococcus opacus]|uniref:Uncharacterized protein n=1 Tax=Rhodococcus opacus TaxID=37919 RepID=A0A1B1KHG6_RHOOP|nr:hypothetical protein R1CP_37255 [Rhodococcus opacus]